jgi:cellulose synthase/poly-beta-1,6-N-acetylglucosamine synthase-like glycosyltransferase
MHTPTIAIACTVRDEQANIAALLDSMLAQSRPADAIIINDCLSQDATAAIVRRYIAAGHPITLVSGGHNIPSGRNNAIRHADAAIIACTDAGLTLDPDWLARISAPIIADTADVVGGFFRAVPESLFELTLGATNYREPEEIDPASFLPFGKSVAFRRAAWERVGGYPEWLSHSEDLVFDRALQAAGYRFTFVPDALVLFRPRPDLWAFIQQYARYARGDGLAGLWPRRHALRYATYAVAAGLLAGARRRPWLLLPLLAGLAGYSRKPLWRLRRRAPALRGREWLQALALIPLIRITGDLAKMFGYPIGLLHRLRRG